MRVLVVASLVSLIASSALHARDGASAEQIALTPPAERTSDIAEARNTASADPTLKTTEIVVPDSAARDGEALSDDDAPKELTGDARDDFDDLPPRVGARPSAMDGLIGVLLKTMLMLALVVGAAYLTLHKGVGKLMARAQQGQRIKVVERVPLGERRSLYLITVDGKEMLLGVGEGGITALATPGARAGERFAALLDEAHTPPDQSSTTRHGASAVVETTSSDASRRDDV